MSGSSLDGLDICHVTFSFSPINKWRFLLGTYTTVELPQHLKRELEGSDQLPVDKLKKLHIQYGAFIGKAINDFLSPLKKQIDIIGVHGHTVFHEPEQSRSVQIGSGSEIANLTAIPTVVNFRESDLLKGGQGAPLVPFGEHHLFSGYDAYLNLGGIANITLPRLKSAYDISYANKALNTISTWAGVTFDKGGALAAIGKVDNTTLKRLNAVPYLHEKPPKSLNNQDFDRDYLPLLKAFEKEPQNGLATYSAFLVQQIGRALKNSRSCLITGGGAFNSHLISLLRKKNPTKSFIIPPREIVEMKEALIFAFLALHRWKNQTNVLASYTGANSDSVGGDLFYP